MSFKDYYGNNVVLSEEIRKFIEKGYNYKIYVGTDSQYHNDKKKVIYATVIVLHKKEKGGKIFVKKSETKNIIPLGQRLRNEAWKSLEIAFELSKELEDLKNIEIVIHIDCNNNKKFKSANYVEELVGMIVGQGYQCVVKPDSFASTSVANKFTK